MQRTFFAVLIAFTCGACGPEVDVANWNKCHAGVVDHPDEVVAGCGAIIKAAQEDPVRLAAAHGLRGNAYLTLKDFDAALADADAAVALAPKWAPARGMRALVHKHRRDFDKSIVDYDAAIAAMPKDAAMYAQRGDAHKWAGHGDLAIEDFSIAIDLGLKRASVFRDRGTVYARQDKLNEAIADFDRALDIEPNDVVTLNNRCYMRALANVALEQALVDCDKALSLKPQAGIYDSRGLVYLRLGKLKEAIADFDVVLSEDPKAAKALYQRGIAKQRNGDADGGAADIAAATALQADVAAQMTGYGLTP